MDAVERRDRGLDELLESFEEGRLTLDRPGVVTVEGLGHSDQRPRPGGQALAQRDHAVVQAVQALHPPRVELVEVDVHAAEVRGPQRVTGRTGGVALARPRHVLVAQPLARLGERVLGHVRGPGEPRGVDVDPATGRYAARERQVRTARVGLRLVGDAERVTARCDVTRVGGLVEAVAPRRQRRLDRVEAAPDRLGVFGVSAAINSKTCRMLPTGELMTEMVVRGSKRSSRPRRAWSRSTMTEWAYSVDAVAEGQGVEMGQGFAGGVEALARAVHGEVGQAIVETWHADVGGEEWVARGFLLHVAVREREHLGSMRLITHVYPL